jgi:hypothetical protein
MNDTERAIATRLPVWVALSELFLDTELDDADHDRIAAVLAASPYSEDKLEEILRFEVTPVLKKNLQSVAGEWESLDPAWLREQLAPRLDHRPRFRLSWFRLVRTPWRDIRARVSARRRTKPNADSGPRQR